MRKTTAGALLAIGMVALSGCATYPAASTLPDGQYAGSSQPEEDGTVGKVRFTIKGGQVVDAEFRPREVSSSKRSPGCHPSGIVMSSGGKSPGSIRITQVSCKARSSLS